MVFLIQQSQNKDCVIEQLDEQDLRDVATFYVRLAERSKTSGPNKEAHSIDEEGMPVQATPAPSAGPAT